MKFVLFHGAFGSPNGNWFPELKEKLEVLGQEVIALQFPVDSWNEVVSAGSTKPLKNQNLTSWLKTIEPIVRSFKKEEKVCFVGHSLGAVFILHVVEKFGIKLDSAIFVSPFLDKLDRWEFNHANSSFYKTDFDFENLKKHIPVSYVLYSDNDPYVKSQHSILFAKALDSSLIFVRRAGHMNSEVNLNEFPLVFELCVTRLDLSLYQRYLAHRIQQQVNDFIIEKGREGVLKLKPEEALDEGIFHFQRLEKSGWGTFYTGGIQFWNTNSKYMEDARKAARRTKNFTRVIMVDRLEDLKSPLVLEQIKADLPAGIKIYLCLYSDIKQEVSEPDFGIWDDEYVCIVRFDKNNHVAEEVELNSRTQDLEIYRQWKNKIKPKYEPVTDPKKDLQQFIASHS